jgi:hypothetical protein
LRCPSVILSGATASLREAVAESKDPLHLFGILRAGYRTA